MSCQDFFSLFMQLKKLMVSEFYEPVPQYRIPSKDFMFSIPDILGYFCFLYFSFYLFYSNFLFIIICKTNYENSDTGKYKISNDNENNAVCTV